MEEPTAQELVEDLAEQYLDRLQAGEQPDRAALLAAYPHIADLLEHELTLREQMHTAVRGSSDQRQEPIIPAKHPEQVGRYVTLEILGQGASGTVYRAYDPKFDRDVALKVLRSDRPLGPDFFKRFEREARIAAQLRHPYIVPIHETGEHAGQPYIDMELIDGETLEARLASGGRQPPELVETPRILAETQGADAPRSPIPVREAAVLVQKLAEALDYAHRQGIIHRDVKPSNVLLSSVVRSPSSLAKDSNDPGRYGLLTTDYGPQLADFGLARRCGAEESLNGQGQILGTVAYMSPEQARGGAHAVDGRSDVYSLGVILYRLLTGRVPFATEESFTTQLYHIVHTEPPKPRSLNPNLPRDLETICLKAMAQDPSDRFATAAEFADELRRWLHDEPLHIRPPTWWEQLKRWARRNRLAARIGVAAAVLLIVVGVTLGGGIAFLQQKRAYEAQVNQILQASETEAKFRAIFYQARMRMRLPTQGRRWETQEILKNLAGPWQKIAAGEMKERLALEARSLYAETFGVPDLLVDNAELPSNELLIWRVALHPEGNAMAIGTHLGPVQWKRGQPLKLPENLDKNQPRPRLAYSPDGKYLAFAPADGGLEIRASADLGRTLGEWKPTPKSLVLAISFTLDGKTVWACTAKGRVQALSLPKLEENKSWEVNVGAERLTAAAFDDKATHLAMGDQMGQVLLHDMDGKPVRELPAARLEVQALAWSPDSRLLAVGTKDGIVQLWHTDKGIPFHWFSLPGVEVSGIQFNPNGRWVFAGERAGSMWMWDVATGKQMLTGLLFPWSFSRDGHSFAGGSRNGVAFCDLFVPQSIRQLTGHHTPVERLAWSSNNRHLVSLDSRFEVRVWDVTRAVSMDAFLAPAGGFYALNAAVAISDDVGIMAYVSGGSDKARAVQRDVRKHIQLGEWPLPGGYEKLTYAQGKFLLIREEDVEKVREEDDNPAAKRVLHGVAYAWEVGKPPQRLREIRPPEIGDERRFQESDLTPDGHFYTWWGPRLPKQRQRVEVREVTTGRLVTRVQRSSVGRAFLSSDGRYLWIASPNDHQLYDLASTNPPERVTDLPMAFSPASHWLVSYVNPDELRGVLRYALRSWGREGTWLELGSDDAGGIVGPVSFSPDGRYLAWCSQTGTITVADIPALQKELGEFEKIVLSK